MLIVILWGIGVAVATIVAFFVRSKMAYVVVLVANPIVAVAIVSVIGQELTVEAVVTATMLSILAGLLIVRSVRRAGWGQNTDSNQAVTEVERQRLMSATTHRKSAWEVLDS